MTRDSSAPPEAQVRVRVLARATPVAEGDDAGWTAFAGDVVATEGPAPVAAGTRVAGFGPSHGSEIRIPAWAVAPVPAGLAVDAAALLPLGGVAVRAARLVGSGDGPARVIGAGPFAELVAKALRAGGTRDVAVVAAPGADLPPVVVDTTGDPAVIGSVLEGAPRFGRVALAGASRGRTVDVDFYRTVHQRGLEVVGVHEFGPLSEHASGEDRERDLALAAALLG